MDIPLFDSHTHLQFATDRELFPLLPSISSAVEPGDWLCTSELMGLPSVSVTYGVHPWYADQWHDGLRDDLISHLQRGAVAVGEIGLDGACDIPDPIQEAALLAQLQIAKELKLPIVLHCHKRFAPLFSLLNEAAVSENGGVLHGFSGSLAVAQQAKRYNLALGIGRTILMPNARKIREAVAGVEPERVLLETDQPTADRSATVEERRDLLLSIATEVARIKGWSVEECIKITNENARRIFRLAS